MTTIANLSVEQLRQALALREQIEQLQSQLARLGGTPVATVKAAPAVGAPVRRRKRRMSAAGRAAIAAAAKARWARYNAGKTAGKKASAPSAEPAAPRKRGKLSAAGRARIVAAQRARWAKIKAARAKAG